MRNKLLTKQFENSGIKMLFKNLSSINYLKNILRLKKMKSLSLILSLLINSFYLTSPLNVFSQDKSKPDDSKKSAVFKLDKDKNSQVNPTKRFALIIGVNNYQEMANLNGAVNDAELLAETLIERAGFPNDQVILLTTQKTEKELQPTRPNILEQLSLIREKIPEDGNALLFVAFSGHGMERIQGKSYLMPSDAKTRNPQLLEDTAIGVEFIKDRILETGVKQVVLLLDSCRNTPQGKKFAEDTLLPETIPNEVSLSKKNQNINLFVTLFATSPGKSAYENRKSSRIQGYYTLAFVEALKGNAANENREVTIGSLIKNLEDEVPKQVKRDYEGVEQIPHKEIYGGELALNFVLSEADPIISPEFLAGGKTYEGKLDSEDERIFQLPLLSNKLIGFEFRANSIDVLISVESPNKKELKNVPFVNNSSKPETIFLITSTGGNYRIKLKAAKSQASGNYSIKFLTYRDSNKGDEMRILAQKAFEEGEQLAFVAVQQKIIKKETLANSEQYTLCVKKFEEALSLFESARKLQAEKQDFEGEIKTRRKFGDFYRANVEDDKSLLEYEKSLIPLRAIEDKNGQAIILILISQIYLKQGKYQESLSSLNLATEALQLNQQTSEEEKINRAKFDLLTSLGRPDLAQPLLAILNNIKKPTNNRETLQLQEILRRLNAFGKNAVMLHTIVTENNYTVILTTPDLQVARRTEIKDIELNRKVFEFRQALQNPNIDPRPLAKELYDILIKPIENDLNQLNTKNLMWSLDGTLRYIPIAALYDGQKYMVEKYNNTNFNTQSLTTLLPSPHSNKNILAMGVTQQQNVNGYAFESLPGVADELNKIVKQTSDSKGILSGKILLNSTFTKYEMIRNLSSNEYNLVHIASHFILSSDTESSFLVLGDGSGFTLEEFSIRDGLFRNVDLLVISNGTSGFSLSGNGKEAEGFAYVAQSQGAKSVIFGLWGVDDLSTSNLMQEFYKQWTSNQGMTKSEALRQAQVSLLYGKNTTINETRNQIPSNEKTNANLFKKNENAPFAHPFYWSSFVLYGNWR